MKKVIIISEFILIILSVSLLSSCKKENPPTVSTKAVTDIYYTTATSGGEVTDDGGATVVARGICWNISSNPTIDDNKTTEGSGPGTYTSYLTQLSANTQYYVRAYATNSEGTGYGSALSFNTDKYPRIRLKSGTGLNYGANIYFMALSKNINYFNLETDELFDYDKTEADWYIDGNVIPFTTSYKDFPFSPDKYYMLLRASGTVVITTLTILDGDQTIVISGTYYGGIDIDIEQPKKSGESKRLKPEIHEYFIPDQMEYIIQR